MTPQLVFLYGPPAVGKLTVANALSKKLGFRVLHNHVTLDAVAAVLDFGTEAFWRVVGRLRQDLVAAAAREHMSLIYTYVYAPEDEPVVARIAEAFEREGGRVTFVQLLAPEEELLRRVSDGARNVRGKITDTESLRRVLEEHDVYQPVRYGPSLTLDLAVLSADEAAARIVQHIAAAEGDEA